jgi:ABC-type multidrug transport system fused ATPase/permease subunit
MKNYPKLTISNLIYFLLKKDNNWLLMLLLIILSCVSYIGSIMFPQLLSNFTNIEIILPKFIFLFIFYTLGMLLHKKISLMFVTKTQTIYFEKILSDLLRRQEEERSQLIPNSVFTDISLFTRDISVILEIFTDNLPILISILFIFLFILKNIGINLSLVFLLNIIIQTFAIYKLSPYAIKTGQNFNNSRNILTDEAEDININIDAILSNDNIEREQKLISNHVKNYKKSLSDNFNYRHIIQTIILTSNLLFTIIAIFYLKKINVSLIFTFILIMIGQNQTLINKVDFIVLIFTFIGKLQNGLENINKFIVYDKDEKIRKINLKTDIIQGKPNYISFRNIVYSYDKQKSSLVIDKLDLELEKIIIFKGKIGSGKTTLLKLLFGLLDLDKGTITFNSNMDNTLLNKKKWRKNIHYTPQHPQLFNRSIEENIFYPNKIAKKEDIDLLKKVGLFDVYQTFLLKENKMGMGGENMSGGQKQIINLFRSILTKKQIILLDEPTSSLDKKNRLIIYNMINIMKQLKKTIIISTHDTELIDLGEVIITL